MTEKTFQKAFSQFLENYWGAFHEALEAQSVTPKRLAGSLFNALLAEHRAFERIYSGHAKSALDGLGHIWHDVEARRFQWPDPPLTHDEIGKAHRLFDQIYDSLLLQGHKFTVAKKEILTRTRHGTPREPLQVDAAR